MGRFLNADAYISTGQGELGNNMFAYCRNNPVHRVDVSGTEDAVCYDEDGKPLSSEDIENLTNGGGSGLPSQGPVIGDPNAPPVNAGQQGKHVIGHNNYQPEKTSWPPGENGVSQTQEAWMNGTQDYKKPGQNVRIGMSSDGFIVRVHMDKHGWIHGYPISPYCY